MAKHEARTIKERAVQGLERAAVSISSVPGRVRSRLPAKWRRKDPPRTRGPVVVLIHGLAMHRSIMWRMGRILEKKYGRRTINIGYNSWKRDIPAAAEHIAGQIAALGLKEFDVVAHSMGCVLVRWAMNHHGMPKLRRAVFIGPPNEGAWLANFLSRKLRWAFPIIWGEAAMQLRRGELGLAARAGLLRSAEVGIIAGGRGTPAGLRNWFGIPGDNDGIVAVEETILPGMTDFVLLNQDHTKIIFSSQTAHMTNLFLEHGVFRPRVAGLLEEH